jgi:hypothetical protein
MIKVRIDSFRLSQFGPKVSEMFSEKVLAELKKIPISCLSVVCLKIIHILNILPQKESKLIRQTQFILKLSELIQNQQFHTKSLFSNLFEQVFV